MTTGVGWLKRMLVTLYLVALHVAVIYLAGDRLIARYVVFNDPGPAVVADAFEPAEAPTSEPIPTILAEDAAPCTTPTPSTEDFAPRTTPTPPEGLGTGRLIIPVAGTRAEQLVDSFADARASGRVHDAIDIIAPAGTPVVAAVDGEIVKFFDSAAGGITIYQLSMDRRFIYYYAHLQRRVEDVKVGDIVRQGKTIAYVGDTGNAGPGNFHLHFSIAQANDPKRYWEGVYLDPYPYLKSGRVPEAR